MSSAAQTKSTWLLPRHFGPPHWLPEPGMTRLTACGALVEGKRQLLPTRPSKACLKCAVAWERAKGGGQGRKGE